MEQNSHYKDGLSKQIKEAYGRLIYSYTSHLKKINRLTKCYKTMKITQIVLSALSTGGFVAAIITDYKYLIIIGGFFSTVLLAINLFFKDVNMGDEIDQHRIASDELWMIKENYLSLLTDFCVLSESEIVQKRDDLQLRTFEIYKKSPKTDKRSYKSAQKALKHEEEQFFNDIEIDSMLPEHLRNK